MKHKQQDLEALFDVIENICSDDSNAWFKSKLQEYLKLDATRHAYQESHEMTALLKDLRRTRGYLEKIDKTFYHDGFRFYQQIGDSALKAELAKDYKMMKVAELEQDLVEYARRIVMQLENCVNFLIDKICAWQLIADNPAKFKYFNTKKGHYTTNLVDGGNFRYSFFTDKSTDAIDNVSIQVEGRPLYRRRVKDIVLPTKKDFVVYYYGCYFDFGIFDNLNFLRNKASHRGKSDEDIQRIERLKQDWHKNSYEFYFMLQNNLSKMIDLF